MDGLKNVRNAAIVLVLAAAVDLLPGGGRGAETVGAALAAVFSAGIALVAVRTYRERRVALHGLGDTHRGMLYGALATAAFAWMARHRMWETGFGELLWWVLVLGVAYAAMEIYRHARSY